VIRITCIIVELFDVETIMTLIYGSVITQGHCLSNAMHGQHIIYLCVSVCVFVTLSVNSPTGQTPQRIFTVDSFTGADLCKGVPFGGLDDE